MINDVEDSMASLRTRVGDTKVSIPADVMVSWVDQAKKA